MLRLKGGKVGRIFGRVLCGETLPGKIRFLETSDEMGLRVRAVGLPQHQSPRNVDFRSKIMFARSRLRLEFKIFYGRLLAWCGVNFSPSADGEKLKRRR